MLDFVGASAQDMHMNTTTATGLPPIELGERDDRGGYTVTYNGKNIGRIARKSDSTVWKATWNSLNGHDPIGGMHRNSYKTRRAAYEALVFVWEKFGK